MDKFRYLNADEIEVRVAQVSKTTKAISLLLYKDARADQKMLDETFGMFGWQKKYERDSKGNLFCIVSIKSPEGEWISKSDVGTESNMESTKGEASDAFKRACFNWGIGRELYTAPSIWISKESYKPIDGKDGTYDRFSVKDIGYDDQGNINRLTIRNDSIRRDVYTMGQEEKPHISAVKVKSIEDKAEADGISIEKICKMLKVKKLEEMTEEQYAYIANNWTSDVIPTCAERSKG